MIKKVTFLLIAAVVLISSVALAETYEQCKERILKNISDGEKETGKVVTQENKDLSVQVYCDRLKPKK